MSPIFKTLLVEDDEDIRETIFEILVNEGHEVTVACDGEDAITCLERKKFDLVITDFKMPKMNGLQLLEWCNANNIHSQVIFITANPKLLIPGQSLLELFQATFIEKPMTLDSILDAVQHAEEHRKVIERDQAKKPHKAQIA